MRLFIIVFILLLVSCQSNPDKTREVEMYNADGDLVGNAKISEKPDGVSIKLKLEGLSPGLHGIHVHEYPSCKGPDFKSAGSHFNPEGKEHGLMYPKGAHLGDLPNIEADAGGLVDTELLLAGATLSEGKKSILTGDGTSLVVDEGKDDGVSQPAGNSGARIICGEIKTSPGNKDNSGSPTDPTQFNGKQEE
ncbi:superoxide dismutase family protein [Virgibacillus halodenitrificans]|uniref:Superoxide dismutase family protein n=1 Tax=Virgibacillus halodenitrificans TaxID=1482 RepID=A0ABR7VR97_VIRHA|nr:superoxide dismutase family protein [Virgibacillus halodenitrificans]MBD1223413.1 superoxide dismutase family protein [Virgibacillus halodenitrificans]MYL46071.1 superoxide dismutase family protein [Virgibacillus halodenitrificans]MYL59834.1 superoxide dismutase family protein [Virgibacillus halodenitrificans]